MRRPDGWSSNEREELVNDAASQESCTCITRTERENGGGMWRITDQKCSKRCAWRVMSRNIEQNTSIGTNNAVRRPRQGKEGQRARCSESCTTGSAGRMRKRTVRKGCNAPCPYPICRVSGEAGCRRTRSGHHLAHRAVSRAGVLYRRGNFSPSGTRSGWAAHPRSGPSAVPTDPARAARTLPPDRKSVV